MEWRPVSDQRCHIARILGLSIFAHQWWTSCLRCCRRWGSLALLRWLRWWCWQSDARFAPVFSRERPCLALLRSLGWLYCSLMLLRLLRLVLVHGVSEGLPKRHLHGRCTGLCDMSHDTRGNVQLVESAQEGFVATSLPP